MAATVFVLRVGATSTSIAPVISEAKNAYWWNTPRKRGRGSSVPLIASSRPLEPTSGLRVTGEEGDLQVADHRLELDQFRRAPLSHPIRHKLVDGAHYRQEHLVGQLGELVGMVGAVGLMKRPEQLCEPRVHLGPAL